jgi:hypothetical protein
MVPNPLPDRESLEALIADLPLVVESFADEDDYYCAVLRMSEGYALKGGVIRLQVRFYGIQWMER